MKGFGEGAVTSKCSCNTSASASASASDSPSRISESPCPEPGSGESKSARTSLWSSLWSSAFSVFESVYTDSDSSDRERKGLNGRSHGGWASAVKRVVSGGGSMRRLHECVLGTSKTAITSFSDIWLLGLCYRISPPESTADATDDKSGLEAFELDFSSRVLITYRKGFDAISDSKYTTDVHWGCMLRSSQMLVAQALLFHRLGRSWRKPLHKPLDQEYIEILYLFNDSEASSFSIHNLIQAGKAYGLAPGSWVGPYAVCRSWETLSRCKREQTSLEGQSLPMAVYIVSGDEDGERGGAPVVCVEDAYKQCLEFSRGLGDWTPILLLVPLVLGLERINPRYIPSLAATFKFPQSLGILGGKPGASTYIVGVQDDKAFYLDPHNVQSAVNIERGNLQADTSSYHCNVIRYIPLDSIDPSLAIGFYCRNKDDFDDFCSRATRLADESNGAPLFTMIHARNLLKPVGDGDTAGDRSGVGADQSPSLDMVPMSEDDVRGCPQEDDWQLL